MIDQDTLEAKFARIGARRKLTEGADRRGVAALPIALDVWSDREGEFFEVIRRPGADARDQVLDVPPADRHMPARPRLPMPPSG